VYETAIAELANFEHVFVKVSARVYNCAETLFGACGVARVACAPFAIPNVYAFPSRASARFGSTLPSSGICYAFRSPGHNSVNSSHGTALLSSLIIHLFSRQRCVPVFIAP
jgi:hypothetical protein